MSAGEEVMRKLTYQEIFAGRPTLAELTDMRRYPIYTLCENIRSLYNVGSIFRTSDAIRLERLYLTGYTGYPPRKEIDKTALGAVDTVNWSRFEDPLEAVAELKHLKIPLIALEHTSKSKPYFDYQFSFPFCLILGNEVEGVSQSLIKAADAALEIPMFGLKQSLNVSVAYGIVMYHALWQLNKTEHIDMQKDGTL
jgi:tRNA G18 (ribose-2'-O)-methylase SpoU